jgi:hypothetical protein
MKKFQFIGLMLLILSACAPQATPTPMSTFTPSPTVQVITSTPESTATNTPAAQATLTTGTPEACKDEVAILSWTRDDVPYDFNDTSKNKPVPPNEHFTMAWTFKNAGTCTWDAAYQLAFKSGVFFTQEQSYPIVPAGQVVAPGQSVMVVVTMVAPSKTGGYQAVWQFQDGKGKSFLNVNVIARVDRGSSKPPSHPVAPKYSYDCAAGVARINLSWTDTANNEDGYRLYRSSIPLVDLPANTASYTDVVPGIGSYEYTVVAYNAAGEATMNISVAVTACQ